MPRQRATRIDKNERADGTTIYTVPFRVRKDGGGWRQTTQSFTDYGDADDFRKMVDLVGGDQARANYNLSNAPRSAPKTPLVADWVEHHITVHSKANTEGKRKLRTYLANDITPALGDRHIGDLTEVDLITWIRQMENTPKMTGDGLPAAATVGKKFDLLFQALKSAVREKHIDENPAEYARTKLPRPYRSQPVFLTEEEFVQLRDGFHQPRYQILIEFLAASGLRWGEAIALHPRDVDLTAGKVYVRHAFRHGDNGSGKATYELKVPKTPHSVREVHVPRNVLARLDLNPKNKFVFTNTNGDPIKTHTFINNVWEKTVKRVGLPIKPSLHDLRHSYASWQIARGVDIKTVQHQLGHKDVKTTLNLYVTRDPKKAEEAAEAHGAMFHRDDADEAIA